MRIYCMPYSITQKEINKLTKKKSGLVIATIITIVLAIIFIAVSIGVNGNIKSFKWKNLGNKKS